MKILITGGNFFNKGAQAMTFIVCSELRNKYPNCEIVMADACYDGNEDNSNLKFVRLQDSLFLHIAYGGNLIEKCIAKCLLRLKEIKNKKSFGKREYINAIKNTDYIIDVSGYSLSSNFPLSINLTFIYELKMAYKNKIPIILMPQSFGPLCFNGIKGIIIEYWLKKLLKYPKLICARETNGYNLLKEKYSLTNIVLSKDMVLQNKKIDYEKVLYNVSDSLTDNSIKERTYIGIVPNSNLYTSENVKEIDNYYRTIINKILEHNEKIFLIYHSGSDRRICNRLKKYYSSNENVFYHDVELNCYEFEKIADKLKFMVASRYHSIVLGYKHYTPSLVLAWAEKYLELAEIFEQKDYLFSINDVNNADDIIEALEMMFKKYTVESEKIKNKLKVIQKENCFDLVFSILDSEGKK